MNYEFAQQVLEAGIKVTKFGRRGKPHARFVFLHGDSIRWADKEGGKPHKRHLPLAEIVDVRTGQTTPVFRRFAKSHGHYESCSFSLVTASGASLDVIVPSESERTHWLAAMEVVLQRASPAFAPEPSTSHLRSGRSLPSMDAKTIPRTPAASATHSTNPLAADQSAAPAGKAPSASHVEPTLQAPPSPSVPHKVPNTAAGDGAADAPLIVSPVSRLGRGAQHFPTTISIAWCLVAALCCAGQGAGYAYLYWVLHERRGVDGLLLGKPTGLMDYVAVISMFSAIVVVLGVVLPVCAIRARKQPTGMSPTFLALTFLAAVAYITCVAVAAGNLAVVCADGVCFEREWLENDALFQITAATALVAYALHHVVRPAVVDDLLRVVLDMEGPTVAFDVLDGASLWGVATLPGVPHWLAVTARIVACCWMGTVCLRLVYALATNLHAGSVLWELPVVGLDPLRVHSRVITRMPGMGRNLVVFSALGMAPFRQRTSEQRVTRFLGRNMVDVMTSEAQHLFWPEQTQALTSHLLTSWQPSTGDAWIAAIVDNVRCVVALRLRTMLATIALPMNLASAAVRVALVVTVPLAASVQAGEFVLKNLASAGMTAGAWCRWRRVSKRLAGGDATAAAAGPHGEPERQKAPQQLFSYAVLLGVALFAVASDWLLRIVKEHHDWSGAGGALLDRISWIAFPSVDAGVLVPVLVGCTLAVAAGCGCAPRAAWVGVLVSTVGIVLAPLTKLWFLFFASPSLLSSDAPSWAPHVVVNLLRLWGAVCAVATGVGVGAVRSLWHPQRSLARWAIGVEVAMDIAGAASLFALAEPLASAGEADSVTAKLVAAGVLVEVCWVATARMVYAAMFIGNDTVDSATSPQLLRREAVMRAVTLPAELCLASLRVLLLLNTHSGVTPSVFLVRSLVCIAQSLLSIQRACQPAHRRSGLCCCLASGLRIRTTEELDDIVAGAPLVKETAVTEVARRILQDNEMIHMGDDSTNCVEYDVVMMMPRHRLPSIAAGEVDDSVDFAAAHKQYRVVPAKGGRTRVFSGAASIAASSAALSGPSEFAFTVGTPPNPDYIEERVAAMMEARRAAAAASGGTGYGNAGAGGGAGAGARK